jgi:FdhD protein
MTLARDDKAREIAFADLSGRAVERAVAIECPVAIECNGVTYAVMMASPDELEDFVVGFALSEGLAQRAQDISDLAVSAVEGGMVVRLSLAGDSAAPLLARVRMRLVEGSCGLCGLDSIGEVLRPLPPVTLNFAVPPAAIAMALEALPQRQPGTRQTGALHAAAFCAPDGMIRLVREDVGRHNALDKLIGALARGGIDPAKGFIVVSARCSYELVEKTARAGCAMLVAISAPTSLALDRARACGMTLVALARKDTMLVFNDPHHMLAELCHGI